MTSFINKKYCQMRRHLGNPYATGSYLGPIPEMLRLEAAVEKKNDEILNTDENKPKEFYWNDHANVILEKLQVEEVKELEQVGKGSFGKVFPCFQVSESNEREKFALKVIAPKAMTPARRKIWKRQARAEVYFLNKMNHENIVKYHDFTFLKYPTMDIKSYMAIKMEHLDCTLAEIIDPKVSPVPLNMNEVTLLGQQIGPALKWMHQHGFVHHDIKPANIMAARFDLKSQDFPGQLRVCKWKITDLGMMKKYRERQGRAKEKYFFGGSPLYMDNLKVNFLPYNPYKADAFAFGVMLLEALLGNARLREDIAKLGKMIDVLAKFLDEYDETKQTYNREHQTAKALRQLLLKREYERSLVEDVLGYFFWRFNM